jgi:hypothetical protein
MMLNTNMSANWKANMARMACRERANERTAVRRPPKRETDIMGRIMRRMRKE